MNELDNKPNGAEKLDAKNAIKQYLKELDIKNIVYVDDRFNIENEKEFFLGFLKTKFKDKEEINLFPSLNWKSPEAKFMSDIKKIWENSDEPTKMGYILKLKTISGDIDELDNSKPALEIKELLPDIIIPLTPDEWIKSKDDVFKNLDENDNILCLFDIDLTNGGSSSVSYGYDGVDLASELLSSKYSTKVYCGLFSHTFSIEEENIKRLEFHKERKLGKKRFYTISKERFSRDSSISGFAEGIKNTLLISEIETLKEKSIELIDDSYQNIKENLENLTPESFNHIVQKRSFETGTWELDTLYRINNILLENEYKKLIADKRKRRSILFETARIRKFESINYGEVRNANLTELKELREKELYIEGSIINKLHYPLSNGDIFKLGNKEYILLVQPCNVSIRISGKREPDNVIGMLVEIMDVKEETLKKDISFFKVREFLDDKKEKYVDFPSYKSINLDFLDLCVFNENGKSFIKIDQHLEIAEYLQAPLKKRFNKLMRTFKKIENGYIAFYEDKNNLTKKNINLFANSLVPTISLNNIPGLNSNPYNPQARTFKFNISRIKRYKSPYSDDLLQKFMLYLSRNGFEFDYTSKQ